jgi:hypothetical protein
MRLGGAASGTQSGSLWSDNVRERSSSLMRSDFFHAFAMQSGTMAQRVPADRGTC